MKLNWKQCKLSHYTVQTNRLIYHWGISVSKAIMFDDVWGKHLVINYLFEC